MTTKSILYAIVGDADKLIILNKYPDNVSNKVKNEAKDIFEKYCKSPAKVVDERHKILEDNNSTKAYYFSLRNDNIFYLIYGNSDLEKKGIFKLMEDLDDTKIGVLRDKSQTSLNRQGKIIFSKEIDKFNSEKGLNKLEQIQLDVENVTKDMQNTIQKEISVVQDVENLDQKANSLRANAQEYNAASKKLKCAAWWQNCKWTIIMVCVIVLLIVIIVPVGIHIGKK